MQTFENLLLQNYSKVFSDFGRKYSLSMCYKSLLKWWRHLHYQQNNSKRQLELTKFNANFCKPSSPKLLNRILRYFTLVVLGYVY